MLVIIGYLIVIFSVFGGYAASGGHVLALFQPLELVMIGGAAVGSFVVSNEWRVIKSSMSGILSLFKSSRYNKDYHVEILSAFYELLTKIRKEGILAIENDINNYKESPLFSKYPLVQSDTSVMEFIVDHMQLITTGRVELHHLDEIIDVDIETCEHECDLPIHAIEKVADSLPAFGIVAAVMGVVHTMEAMTEPPEVLGSLIAKALVGTFLGVLLGYGFVAPLAVAMKARVDARIKVLQAVKILLVAAASNAAPSIAVEMSRKLLYSDLRPNSGELEEIIQAIKSSGGTTENAE